MKFSFSSAAAWGFGLVALLLGVAIVAVLWNDRQPSPMALPLMFWTLHSALLVIAMASSIGLPGPKAVFWRAWLVTVAACQIEPFGNSQRLLGMLIWGLPEFVEQFVLRLMRSDSWAYGVVQATTYTLLGVLAGTVALVVRPREVTGGTFRFRLLHLFVLSSFVACTSAAIQNPTPLWGHISFLSLFGLRMIAGIGAASGRGHATLLWGCLAGSFAWDLLANQNELIAEWSAVLGSDWWHQREPGMMSRWYIARPLLSVYAGLITGLLAAVLYRPPSHRADL